MATRRQLDPLDEADDAITELKRLGGEDEEETGRVNLPPIHIHAPQPSTPQIEVSQPEPGVFKIAYTAVSQLRGWPLFWTLAVIAGCYTFLKWSGKL